MKTFICTLTVMIVSVLAYNAQAVVFNTKHVEIYYEDADLFKIFSRNLTYGNRLFKKIPIEKRVDMLFVRVQDLLGIPKAHKLKVELLNRTQMLKPMGYYTHYNRTIHISARDTKNKVLAHEMAHAMFDDFLGKRAPGRMGEIMAKYVARNI